MKVTVDVDCTPEEARRFLGLPDLSPVHAAYVEKMKSAVTDGPTPEMFGDMMKAWGPMNEAGMNMWKQMLDQMGGKTRTLDGDTIYALSSGAPPAAMAVVRISGPRAACGARAARRAAARAARARSLRGCARTAKSLIMHWYCASPGRPARPARMSPSCNCMAAARSLPRCWPRSAGSRVCASPSRANSPAARSRMAGSTSPRRRGWPT